MTKPKPMHIAACLAMASMSPYAFSSENIETITVTGELLKKDLQHTHTSVAVITGSDLAGQADADFYDVVDRTPGVVSAFGEKGFVIRGIDQRGVGGSGAGMTVSTTVDGATVSNVNQLTFFGPYSTWDLEQIEILRGPQSTQTGRNALAGAINIRSKDPVYDEEIKVEVEAGARDTTGVALAFNTAPIHNRVAFRLAVDRSETDGYIDNPTQNSDEFDSRLQSTVRAALRFDPTEDLDVIYKLTRSENRGGEDVIEYSEFPDRRRNYSDEPSREYVNMTSQNLRIGYDINSSWRLESESNYFDSAYSRHEDTDFTAEQLGTISRDSDVSNLQQEVRFMYSDDRISSAIGLFYTDISSVAPAGGTVAAEMFNPGFAGLGAFIDARIDQTNKIKNSAIFGEIDYALTNNFSVIFGARYDYEEAESVTVNDFVSENATVAGFLPPPTTETRKESFGAFLPKASLVYDFNDELGLGFTVQQGYRSGGTSVNLATGERNKYDPEFTTNYEFSLRSKWLNNNLTANANVFFTDWKDQQVNVQEDPEVPANSIVRNAGSSEVYGAELEITADVTNDLTMYSSLAYAKTEFTDFVTGDDDFTGNKFPFASDVTAAIGAEYYFNHRLHAGLDVNFTGEAFIDSENTEALQNEDRTLTNLRVGYAKDDWEVIAYVRNLTDEDYFTQALGSSDGIDRVRAGEPRTFGLIARTHF